jgi:hypothetical protein
MSNLGFGFSPFHDQTLLTWFQIWDTLQNLGSCIESYVAVVHTMISLLQNDPDRTARNLFSTTIIMILVACFIRKQHAWQESSRTTGTKKEKSSKE